MMNAMIKEIEISDDFEEKNTLTPIDIVIKICLNFHRAILQMKKDTTSVHLSISMTNMMFKIYYILS